MMHSAAVFRIDDDVIVVDVTVVIVVMVLILCTYPTLQKMLFHPKSACSVDNDIAKLTTKAS